MSHDHDDYAVEPIRGLPEMLPAGEHILWQGAPDWWQLAKDVFHIRGVAAYLFLLMAWRGGVHWTADHNAMGGLVTALSLLPISLVGLGLLGLLAWLSSRTSVYTITNHRVVMRIGVALPTAINIPFRVIRRAGLHAEANGTGNIALLLIDSPRMAYSNLWPHVRPWRLAQPEPMLRAIPEVQRIATLLATAMAQALPETAVLAAAEGLLAEKRPSKPVLATARDGNTLKGQPA